MNLWWLLLAIPIGVVVLAIVVVVIVAFAQAYTEDAFLSASLDD